MSEDIWWMLLIIVFVVTIFGDDGNDNRGDDGEVLFKL